MTDREKAFVLNGLRNYGRTFNIRVGIDPDDVDRKLAVCAKALNISGSLLEETRLEQQQLVEQIVFVKLLPSNWVEEERGD